MKLKNLVIAILLVAVVVLGFQVFRSSTPAVEVLGSSGSTYTNFVEFLGGARVANLTDGGNILSIATTSSTYTLTSAQLDVSKVISIADTGTSTSVAISVTLPATSTMTSLLSKNGDSRAWFIHNLHTAAATTTTILAGTGIDLQGDTANDDIINGGVIGKLECFRIATRDVVCNISEKVVAD